MRIFLTGASGLLGGNFAAVAARAGHDVIGTIGTWSGAPLAGLAQQLHLDLRDGAALAAAVRAARPEAIVNAAALSEPAQCEREPELAAALNVALPRQLAELAAELDARVVHVSSEQVFDGTRAPYRVADPVAPLTLYGRQKADSERVVLAVTAGRAAVVRVPLLMGNSPGGRRSVHERLLRDWCEGRVARLFTDEIRQVCMADNLAAALLELCAPEAPAGILHWAGAEPVSRHELGRALAACFGVPTDNRLVATQLAGTALAATRQHDLSMDLWPLSEALTTKPEPLAVQLERLVLPAELRGSIARLRSGG
ncbi:MAG TPA: sugar nucleotide-binding protein [Opitutaceae bacterium]|nr:sugar nucleotide-binding protein [Opitutaceae bacterium]